MCFPYAGEGTFQTTSMNTSNATSSNSHVFETKNPTVPQTPCPKTIHYIPQPVVARLKVFPLKKGNPCEGRVDLYSLDQRQRKGQLCLSSYPLSWSNLCKDMRCGEFKGFIPTNKAKGFILTSNMTLQESDCQGLQITCEGKSVHVHIQRRFYFIEF